MSKADITSVIIDLGILDEATARRSKMPDYGSGSGSSRGGVSTGGAKPVEVPSKRRSKKTLLAKPQSEAGTKQSLVAELRKRKGFLTTGEVMSFVNIKRRDTICKYVRRGKLKAHDRIGNGYRFCPLYIADWIERRQL
ncbi:MAG: helix-turn-helix domain-containing protein [Bryobacteraceae bacterium]